MPLLIFATRWQCFKTPFPCFSAAEGGPLWTRNEAFLTHASSQEFLQHLPLWWSLCKPVGILCSVTALSFVSPPAYCSFPCRLLSEVEELNMSLRALKEKLQDAEQALRNLEDSRMSLEKDIAVKTNSLFIDRQKCMTHRNRYPSVLQLAGYQ